MNNAQERAAFEAWAASIGFCVTGKYAETSAVLCAKSAFEAGFQAALASPEVRALRKDAERLDFMISEECQIQSLSTPNEVRHRLGWPDYGESQSEWFTNPRAALDVAMEKKK